MKKCLMLFVSCFLLGMPSFLLAQLNLNIEGDAKITGATELGGVSPTETLLFGRPNSDGFNILYDENYNGTGKDYLVFEKTDKNSNAPDGGLVFVGTGMDNVQDELMILTGNGNMAIGPRIGNFYFFELNSSTHPTSQAFNLSTLIQKQYTPGLGDNPDHNLYLFPKGNTAFPFGACSNCGAAFIGDDANRWNIIYSNSFDADGTSRFATTIPRTDNSYSLGLNDKRWTEVWAVDGTI